MRRSQQNSRSVVIKRSVAILAAVGLLVLSPSIYPLVGDFLGRAAVFSAALTMPEGAALTLQERYAPEIYAPDGLSPEGEREQPPASAAESEDSGSAQVHDPYQGVGGSDSREAPEIPEEYRGELRQVFYEGENNPSFYNHDGGWIRNYSNLSDDEIAQVLSTGFAGMLTPSEEPQILIYHTHTTESYEEYDSIYYDMRNTWRSTDNNNNMAVVGEALKEALEAQGFVVIHDTTQHDYPSYNGSYERSRETIEGYLEKYPTIQVLLDVHRDAILYEDQSIAKPVVEVDGRKAAQVMIAAACDSDGSTGVPGWEGNIRLAAAINAEAQRQTPGLMRPVFFAYRNYNQDLSPQALLLEFGSNGNTLEEAVYAAELLGPILAEVLEGIP